MGSLNRCHSSLSVKVAVALQCLSLALDHWAALDGAVDLVDLIDEGFATVSGTGVLAEHGTS